MRDLLRADDGQTTIEYALVALMVVVSLAGVLAALAGGVTLALEAVEVAVQSMF